MHKQDILLPFLKGEHRESDSYKVALFLEEPGLNYSKDGEVKGPGYIAGGKSAGTPIFGANKESVYMTFEGDVVWPGSSLAVRHVMLYNHRTKLAVFIESFEKVKSSENDRFTVSLPGLAAPLVHLKF